MCCTGPRRNSEGLDRTLTISSQPCGKRCRPTGYYHSLSVTTTYYLPTPPPPPPPDPWIPSPTMVTLFVCRHLHQLVGMPLHTPNMVNMMMETEPAIASGGGGAGGQQPISAAITAQLGAPADLAQHAQQLGQSLLTWHSMPSMVTS